ncbi:hypothetical protein KEM54_001174 [Ascosphaera aggregata]|nr:hypothetical protein KEM54_001174 [Ascosphaera aggregata]
MFRPAIMIVLLLWTSTIVASAQAGSETRWVTATDKSGSTINLPDNRKPALYTEEFGSCMENPLLTLDYFEASFFKDNMSLTFQFQGATTLDHDDLMSKFDVPSRQHRAKRLTYTVSLTVVAYGERRVAMVFSPCNANLYSLCPPEKGKPVSVSGLVPLSEADIAVIPPIAMTIPDFEGQATIQIFSNVTRSQIGCYQSTVTNGNTMSHPYAVNAVLIFFAFIAFLSSSLMALLDADVPTIRRYYAHSPSVLVTVSVFQYIFFSGAVSVNWPRVLVSFWSNFAWLAGMVHTSSLQRAISRVTSPRARNLLKLGSTPTGFSGLMNGGYDIHEIYGTGSWNFNPADIPTSRILTGNIELPRNTAKRDINEDFCSENPLIGEGLPLPGDHSGFPGTLFVVNIPAVNTFLTGLVWLLILAVIVIGSIPLTKFVLEILVGAKLIRKKWFAAFRRRWRLLLVALLGRLFLCGFYMLIFTAVLQFSLCGRASMIVLTTVILTVIVSGVCAIVARAALLVFKNTEHESLPLRERFSCICRNSWTKLRERGRHESSDPDDNEVAYLRRFAWLSARYRQERWWFFAPWLGYELLRGCIFGAAVGNPFRQIFLSLALEIAALAYGIWMRPFEATHLNVLAIYLLGGSKVLTLGLSAAFIPQFQVPRIPATVIGIIIIIIQGLLAIVTVSLIIIGIIRTHRSRRFDVTDDHSDQHPHPLPLDLSRQSSQGLFDVRYLSRDTEILKQTQGSSGTDLTEEK